MRGNASAQNVGLRQGVVCLGEHFDFEIWFWKAACADQPRSLLKKTGRVRHQSGRLLLSVGCQFTGSGLVGWLLGAGHQVNDAGSGFGCPLGGGSGQCLACCPVGFFGVDHLVVTMGRAGRFGAAGAGTRAPAPGSMVSGLRAVGMAITGRSWCPGLL